MSGLRLIICLLLSSVCVSHAFRKDAEVSCVYEESCVLPCSVPGHLLEIIWSKIPEMIPVQWHSRDQTFHQHYSYRNRTFLFCDQISQGNCSLRLTEVKPLDNGTYQCNSLTNSSRKFFFVNIKVNAPVKTVNIEHSGEVLICSSGAIYPKPELRWSLSKTPLPLTNNTVLQNKQQLYSITGTLPLLHRDSHKEYYICTVSTPYSWRRATFTLLSPVTILGNETTVHCATSFSPIKSLIWTFNNIQTILNLSSESQPWEVSETWRRLVKNISENGSLTLKDLTPDQQGLYTCHLTTDKETHTISTQLKTQVFSDEVVISVVTVVFIVTVLVLCCTYKQDKKKQSASMTEAEPLQFELSVSPSPTPAQPPQDQYNLVRIIFFIMGLGSLMSWHFFVTASLYFKYRINTTDKTWTISLMTLISQLSQLLPMVLSSFFHLRFTQRKHSTVNLVMIVLLFLAIAVLCSAVPMAGGNFFSIAMGLIWFTMLFSALLHCNLFGLVSLLPDIYRNTFTHGQAAAGPFAALIMLFSIAITKDYDSAALCHFLIACCGTLITLFCYLSLSRLEFAQHFLNQSQKSEEEYSLQPLKTQTNQEQNGTTKPKKKRNKKKKNRVEPRVQEQVHTCEMPKNIRRALCVISVPTITMCVFPAVTADIQTLYPGKWEPFFIPVCCFLIFNICDWFGQISATWVCCSRDSRSFQVLFPVLVVIRAGFIPLFMFSNVQSRRSLPVVPLLSHDKVFGFIMMLFSFSNGWLGRLSMSYGPHQEQGADTPKSLWVAIGMTTGTALSFGIRAAV